MVWKRKEHENEYEYIYRVCSNKEAVGTWQDVANILNEELGYEYTESRYRKMWQMFDKMMDGNKERFSSVGEETARIIQERRELEKERKKIQTEKLEYNKMLREDARDELVTEKIVEAISKLEPIKFGNKYPYDVADCDDRVGVLCFGDAHYGSEIFLEGATGVVNVYSPEIFKVRMGELLRNVIYDKERFINYRKLIVIDVGDAVQGYLRMSDIVKCSMGVMDSVIEYAEYVSNWLTKLSDELCVPVEYYTTTSNHSNLRLLQSKPMFPEEDVGKIINKFIELRTKDNPNVYVGKFKDHIFLDIDSYTLLAMHGQGSKTSMAEMAFWEDYHGKPIDCIVLGHLHHKDEQDVGVGIDGKEVMRIPSICGCDVYSVKVRSISKAGAKFFVVENGSKTWERTYVLN